MRVDLADTRLYRNDTVNKNGKLSQKWCSRGHDSVNSQLARVGGADIIWESKLQSL